MAALWVPSPFDLKLVQAYGEFLLLLVSCLGVWACKEANVFFVSCMSSGVCCYGNEVPMQVFLTPVEGETTALVPEPLYKVLAGTSAAQSSGVRILNSEIEFPSASGSILRMTIKSGD